MLRRKPLQISATEGGFTLIELTMVMIMVVLVAITMYGFFSSSFSRYFSLQKDATNFGEMAVQTQRVATVLRGSTDVVSASSTELTVYAYFAPADTYVSQIRYYLNANKTVLYADVTRMTANPPIGVTIPSSLTTYTIISNYHYAATVNLFTYLDANGNTLAMPLGDLKTIKGIRISLSAPSSNANASHNIDVQVSLRNRKTNL